MARRYFIKLSYDGTPFHGWQIQKNAKSIQQTLNEALSTVIRQEIYTVGCGRTDTGVHALNFFAHFNCEEEILELESITFRVNCVLPKEIAIESIFLVQEDWHTRFSATSRSYVYRIHSAKDPFSDGRSYEYKEPLDIELMQAGCDLLKNAKDFTSFSKLHSDTTNNLCDIQFAEWSKTDVGYQFRITANRFLRNMVRAVVGTTMELGMHKIDLGEFQKVIDAKDRSAAGFSVPAHGLYLSNITYPAEFKLNE
jgi:tRNA pseudouridine38-40 synthase